tara:strand:+ start:1696 stop:1854 length:159 start_codon:yes stop_codon:yes gene_type:complete
VKKWKQLKKRIKERRYDFANHNPQMFRLYLMALTDIQEIMKEIEHSKKELGK